MLPPTEYLLAFSIAALLLTITPGLDTALVLRTAAVEGGRRALQAGLGIAAGCLGWGLIAAAGLGALLAASEAAYNVLRWIGALYLFYLGFKLLRAPAREFASDLPRQGDSSQGWFWRGFLTNMLNPKVGVFYVSFLPQFIPLGTNVFASSTVLALIHAVLGIGWFVALILATRPISRVLRRPTVTQWLDRITGLVFVGFGVRLLASHRH
ncbi:LysE family translocator [Altererythrobacter arenosus]|uniref:LysE family translocator n=1 Tax=Altererythrobacter arenosus TaxID=3032592 RepID=A0ABY8FTY8_9SPHN|nr:LysE family translocator [Altererythrobacter sp. CAU 1644]WFL76861.1 LysE family translocator [Altererythrobacter sp. CAU 1644]